MIDDAQGKRLGVTFLGDLTKISDELKESVRAGSRISKIPTKLLVPDIPPARFTPLTPPEVRTTAEVKKLNLQLDTLVRAMLDLIAVTKAEAESTKASSRLIVRLAVATVILTGVVAALTLLLVLR